MSLTSSPMRVIGRSAGLRAVGVLVLLGLFDAPQMGGQRLEVRLACSCLGGRERAH